MRRSSLFLCAMLLLARPQPTQAGTPALAVPGVVQAGQGLEIRWQGLPGATREVELELSLDGGRWVRISPELEAEEGHYLWHVPAVISARARLRLRAGGEGFEAEVTASAEFRIESREAASASRARALDWWQVGERTGAPGWACGPHAATLSSEGPNCVAEPDSRSEASAPAPSRSPVSFARYDTNPAACAANAAPAASRRLPLRL